MKYYNVEGYVRHKLDLEETLKNMKHEINYDEINKMFESNIEKLYLL